MWPTRTVVIVVVAAVATRCGSQPSVARAVYARAARRVVAGERALRGRIYQNLRLRVNPPLAPARARCRRALSREYEREMGLTFLKEMASRPETPRSSSAVVYATATRNTLCTTPSRRAE